VEFLVTQKVKLPDASDVGCYAVRGDTYCNLDLSEDRVRSLVDPRI